jgi:hypothetical protein
MLGAALTKASDMGGGYGYHRYGYGYGYGRQLDRNRTEILMIPRASDG